MRNTKRRPKFKTERERLRDIELDVVAEEFAHAMKQANLRFFAGGGLTTLRMQDIWGRYMAIALEYADLEA